MLDNRRCTMYIHWTVRRQLTADFSFFCAFLREWPPAPSAPIADDCNSFPRVFDPLVPVRDVFAAASRHQCEDVNRRSCFDFVTISAFSLYSVCSSDQRIRHSDLWCCSKS